MKKERKPEVALKKKQFGSLWVRNGNPPRKQESVASRAVSEAEKDGISAGTFGQKSQLGP